MSPRKILGLAGTVTRAEIDRKYRQLVLLHHPDHGGDSKRMAEINAAYAALSTVSDDEPQRLTLRTPDNREIILSKLESEEAQREIKRYESIIERTRKQIEQEDYSADMKNWSPDHPGRDHEPKYSAIERCEGDILILRQYA